MIYVTECSVIPIVDHATATVGDSEPILPIDHNTQVLYDCNTGYSSTTSMIAVCGDTTPGLVNVSSFICYQGNVFFMKKNFEIIYCLFGNFSDIQLLY